LVDRPQKSGYYEVVWDGENDVSESVSSGAYFYKLKVGDKFSQTKKLLLLR